LRAGRRVRTLTPAPLPSDGRGEGYSGGVTQGGGSAFAALRRALPWAGMGHPFRVLGRGLGDVERGERGAEGRRAGATGGADGAGIDNSR
jgi:hypothetical protein